MVCASDALAPPRRACPQPGCRAGNRVDRSAWQSSSHSLVSAAAIVAPAAAGCNARETVMQVGRPASRSHGLPRCDDFRDGCSNQGAGLVSRPTVGQQLVVSRVFVSDVSLHRKSDRVRLKLLGCGRAANPTRVLLARMLGNRTLLLDGAAGKQLADALCERADVGRQAPDATRPRVPGPALGPRRRRGTPAPPAQAPVPRPARPGARSVSENG